MKAERPDEGGEQLRRELSRCVRCGACLAHCPVYREVRREWAVARGRLALLEATGEGQLRPSRRLQQVLESCLLCGACVAGCPNQVDTPAVVREGRRLLAESKKGGGGFWRRVLRGMLSPRRMPGLVRAARALRPLWAASVPEESGLRLRLLRPEGERIRVPRLAERFLDDFPLPRDFGPPAEHGRPTPFARRVAVFPGCVEKYVRPETCLSELNLLGRLGVDATVPEGLGCCGSMAWSAGESDTARRLFLNNLERLLPEGKPWPDVVTGACSSCCYMLSRGAELFPVTDEKLKQKLGELSRRILPFASLYGKEGMEAGSRPPSGAKMVRVGWHDPCHLALGFSERESPRRVLRALAGAEYIELPRAGECCGGGGIFSFLNPGLSQKIGARKRQDIAAAEVEFLVTECSGCLMQLERVLAGCGVGVLTLPQAVEKFTCPGSDSRLSVPENHVRA